jgi:hypothetical protein
MMGNLVPQQGKESMERRIEPNDGQSGTDVLLCTVCMKVKYYCRVSLLRRSASWGWGGGGGGVAGHGWSKVPVYKTTT